MFNDATTSLSNLSDEAEESAIDFSIGPSLGPTVSLYGNLSTEKKKDIQVSRVAHVRLSRFTLLADAEPRNLVFAIGMPKPHRRTLKSSPMDLPAGSRTMPLSLTFSFIYTHTLKGPGETFRVLVHERSRGGDLRLLASAPLHMQAVVQCPFAGEISLRSPSGDGQSDGHVWAKIQAVVASYTEDIESPEEAREWEDVLSRPEAHFKAAPSSSAIPPPMPASASSGAVADEAADEEEEREAHASLANRVRAKMKKKLAHRGGSGAVANTRFRGIKSLLPGSGHANNSSDSEREERFDLKERRTDRGDGSSLSAVTDSLSDRSDFEDEAPRPMTTAYVTSAPLSTKSSRATESSAAAIITAATTPTTTTTTTITTTSSSTTTTVYLVNPLKRTSKRLQDMLEKSNELRHGAFMEVRNAAEAAAAVTTIFNIYQQRTEQATSTPLKIVFAGSDKLVQHFLRPFLEQLARRPRGWAASGFAFFLLPLGKRNELAQHVGSFDATYKSFFLASDWTELWQQQQQSTQAEASLVCTRVHRYLSEALHAVRFDIGEAWASLAKAETATAGGLQLTVPFIRGVQLGSEVRVDKKEAEVVEPPGEAVDLQVDYWLPATTTTKKDEQVTMKHAFQCVALTRLPGVAASLRLERPSSSGFSLLLQWREKKKVLGISKTASGKTVKMHTVPSRASKVTLAAQEPFALRVDGVELKDVLSLSVSLHCAGPLKALPIVSFVAPPPSN